MSRPMPAPDDPAPEPVQNPHSRPEQTASLAAHDEIEELDRLYRQALDVMDAVERQMSGGVVSGEWSRLPLTTDHSPVTTHQSPLTTHQSPLTTHSAAGPAVTPRQVIEAALFVGGTDLTTKKLCLLLRNEFDADFVHAAVDELNARYAREGRPYEIRFGEGGYRMVVRREFDRLRYKAFGLGPKEVRLSQEALEVLALVAYRQPLSPEEIAELGRANAGAVLRQLLRRELIALERNEQDPREVTYRTTPRFLELFGLSDIEELPRAEELSFK